MMKGKGLRTIRTLVPQLIIGPVTALIEGGHNYWLVCSVRMFGIIR
jgi:hypothetical protein